MRFKIKFRAPSLACGRWRTAAGRGQIRAGALSGSRSSGSDGYEYHFKTHTNERDNAGGLISAIRPLCASSHIPRNLFINADLRYNMMSSLNINLGLGGRTPENAAQILHNSAVLINSTRHTAALHTPTSRASVFGFNKCYLHSAHSFQQSICICNLVHFIYTQYECEPPTTLPRLQRSSSVLLSLNKLHTKYDNVSRN